MKLSLIAAIADNGVIGRDNRLPWHLPADLRRFKQLTRNHHVVMGRRTYESIGKPLPRRVNLVLSHAAFEQSGVSGVRSLDEAVAVARDSGETELFVLGGVAVFETALPVADRLYITWVHASPEGDVHFPTLDLARFDVVQREEYPATDTDPIASTFVVYDRRAS